MRKLNGIFFSFLLGGTIGSVIALLYTPKSGEKLRNDLSRKTNELIEKGKKKTFDILDKTRERAESTIDNANEMLNTGAEKVVHKTQKLKDSVKSGLKAYNDESDSENNQSNSSIEDVEKTRVQNK